MLKVIKRDGSIQDFYESKITSAIKKAGYVSEDVIFKIIGNLMMMLKRSGETEISVERIQDYIEKSLSNYGYFEVAKRYILYRDKRRRLRDIEKSALRIVEDKDEEVRMDNANKNSVISSTQRDYLAGILSKHMCKELLVDNDIWEAHKAGKIHFHDADYFLQKIPNCMLVDLDDMLQNGTVINKTMITKPHSFKNACNIATQIIAIIASEQYGGQTITLSHLAPFIDVSRKELYKRYSSSCSTLTGEQLDKIVEAELNSEIRQGVQALQYQILTLNSSNGQTPFVSINMDINEPIRDAKRNPMKYKDVDLDVLMNDLARLIEEVLNQRIAGILDEAGNVVSAVFPKLLYVLDDNNIKEGEKYYYLTKLAVKCTVKRMVPDYISAKIMKRDKKVSVSFKSRRDNWNEDYRKEPNHFKHLTDKDCEMLDRYYGLTNEHYQDDPATIEYLESLIDKCGGHKWLVEEMKGDVYPCMGCRSFLTPDPYNHRYYGRFNQGVVTLNLPYIALESGFGKKDFMTLLESYCELAHRALQLRHKRLLYTVSDISPLHFQHGAASRLGKHDVINALLFNNNSTISLGYAGLYECVEALTGGNHYSDNKEAHDLAVEILNFLNRKCAEWRAYENISYSLYGTPEENLTDKFARALKVFPEVKNVNDHDWVTNSYHVYVRDKMTAFEKIKKESEFSRLSPGGAISYVEMSNMIDNPEAVMEVVKCIYDNIMYCELNCKLDICQKCGYNGEIEIFTNPEDRSVHYRCPKCGNEDRATMVVIRRVCGYLSSNEFNYGRASDIINRVIHLGGED